MLFLAVRVQAPSFCLIVTNRHLRGVCRDQRCLNLTERDRGWLAAPSSTPLTDPVASEAPSGPPVTGKSTDKRSNSGGAAADRYAIFEQVALERLRNSGDATKPVELLPLPVRLTALAAASITGLGVLWAFFAHVPVQVIGLAAITPEGVVSSFQAGTDGVLYYQVSGVGPDQFSLDGRRRNQALARFWGQSAIHSSTTLPYGELNALVLDAMAPAEGQRVVLPETSDASEPFDRLDQIETLYRQLHYPANTLISLIQNTAAMEELDAARRVAAPKLSDHREIGSNQRKRAVAYVKVDSKLVQQRQRLQKELADRQALYERLVALSRDGGISQSSLFEESATINNLKNQLLQAERDQLGTDVSRVDSLQQARQAALESLQTIDQLQAALVQYMAKVYAVSPPSGIYLFSRQLRNGSHVRAGDELFTYSLEPPALPKTISVFVNSSTVQQIAENMKVLVTPKGISRAQYGGIPGRVVEVGRLPLTREGLKGFVGSQSLASEIQQVVGTPYQVRVQLEQAETAYCRQLLSRRCYRWSTRRVPPVPVRLGTEADVQITTTYRRPMEFVMPMLRQALGLVVENR